MDDGVSVCVSEACLPVKLFHAHVLELKDRADFIFVPRFTSISKNEFICPKCGGISDMVRSSIRELPEIIDVEIDMRKSGKGAEKAAMEAGLYFTKDKKKIKNSYHQALSCYKEISQNYKDRMLPDSIEKGTWKKSLGSGLKILLLGHAYNVYDSFLNLGIVDKIRNYGADVITLEMFDEDTLKHNAAQLNKPIFWEYGSKAIGSIYEVIKSSDLDGIIYLMCFGCGIDSFISNMAERRIKATTKTPFITITLDEQSGQAGIDTRLEAFMDTLKWRKDDTDISASGQRAYMCKSSS